jgi:arabinoxylan arabinofuranohydrolase
MINLKMKVLAGITTVILTLNTNAVYSQDVKTIQAQDKVLKVVNNPIISNYGVCDPHIHIFNNKAYIFASHDREPFESFYGMYDWWVWSSTDLVHWKMEYNLFPTDMWVGATNNAWAVDGVERNGKSYFYVSGNWKTGVAVSNTGAAGPYKDALGKHITDKMSYDPTVFIDDDANKTPYLITNGFPYRIARLNEDMISLAEEPKDLTHTTVAWNGDGGFLHKRNGIYYLNGHGTKYSTATNIYGPYTYRGTFYKKWVDHPGIFSWNNQTYCAFGAPDVGTHFRKTHLTYVHYKANGDMFADGYIGDSFIGVGQYDCSKKIEAEWYFAASDGTDKREFETGFVVSNLTNNASLYYQRVLNVQANAEISIQVSSANDGGVIEVRLDKANGKLLGKIEVPNTGSLTIYKNVSSKLKNSAGLNNLYLVYKGKTGNSANLDWLTISSTGAIVEPPKGQPIIIAAKPNASTPVQNAYKEIQAENPVCYNALRVSNTPDGEPSKCIANLKNNSYASYMIDFGAKANESLNFEARLSAVKAGSIEIHSDSFNGPLLGTCTYESTEALQKWVTKDCKVNAPAGIKHIFIVFKMQDDAKFHNSAPTVNLNWIKFVQ